MMGIENESEILEWDLSKLYNQLKVTNLEQQGSLDKFIHEVQEGYKLKIPIWYIINEWYEIYPSTKRVKIFGFGKVDIIDFMNEVNEREERIRFILFEILTNEQPTKPRG